MLSSLLFAIMIVMSAAESDIVLENPGFEIPPTNITTNSITPFVLLTESNSIPGWEFNGTVWYVTSGPNISLPGNGHAVQLGRGGKISLGFTYNDRTIEYTVTFTLAPGRNDCLNQPMGLKVSSQHKSSVFFFKGGRYGRQVWESHAFGLGRWTDDSIKIATIEFESIESGDVDSSLNCWPVLDTVLLIPITRLYGRGEMVNGGFEIGPAFISNSSDGILLDEEPARQGSVVQEWGVTGMVKYIDSKHFSVPQRKSAIQLLSGSIKATRALTNGRRYNLGFAMGDANDSCIGELTVHAIAGVSKQKFTKQSNGTGSSSQYSMRFRAKSVVNIISFQSLNEMQSSDGVPCGPVIDNVTLRASHASTVQMKHNNQVLVILFFLTLVFFTWCR